MTTNQQTPQFRIVPEHNTLAEFDPKAALEQYRIDLSSPMNPPTVYVYCQDAPVMTEHNISGVIGKAKSKKTFTVISIIAAALSGHCLNFYAAMKGLNVILIDTEQSPFHARRTADRIERLAGQENMKRFTAYALRPLKPEERLATIEKLIEGITSPTMLIIDGVKDLGYNFNDLQESTLLINIMMKWTYEKPMHIVSVLHTNKGDNTARGHIGQELINKSETVLQVDRDAKNRDVSTITAEFTRDIDFNPFPFTIDHTGLPILLDSDGEVLNAKEAKLLAEIEENFTAVLPGMIAMQYGELTNIYKEISGKSEATAKRHISEGLKKKIISRDHSGRYRLTNRIEQTDDNVDDPF